MANPATLQRQCYVAQLGRVQVRQADIDSRSQQMLAVSGYAARSAA